MIKDKTKSIKVKIGTKKKGNIVYLTPQGFSSKNDINANWHNNNCPTIIRDSLKLMYRC